MATVRWLHVALAYVTVIGFTARALLSLVDPSRLRTPWLRVTPHVIDTLLLAFGLVLVVQLQLWGAFQGWLGAKVIGLLAYIGFGVMALRASSRPKKLAGLVLALLSVGYVFAVAYTRRVMPL